MLMRLAIVAPYRVRGDGDTELQRPCLEAGPGEGPAGLHEADSGHPSGKFRATADRREAFAGHGPDP